LCYMADGEYDTAATVDSLRLERVHEKRLLLKTEAKRIGLHVVRL
jgi:ribosomal protein L30/L7E